MRCTITLLLALLVLGPSAHAQNRIKETVKLSVIGPGLTEITDPGVLNRSNVFAGYFIGTPATEPDPSWTRYTIVFDIQTREGIKEGAYVVCYVSNPTSGEGFIYLPGRDDPPYRRNISTILVALSPETISAASEDAGQAQGCATSLDSTTHQTDVAT